MFRSRGPSEVTGTPPGPSGAPAAPPRVGPVAWLLVWPIRFYQRFISRYTPPTCRYYPCCSSYAIGALRTHGAVKGLILTAWRLLRCNPWSDGGIDHVPPRGRWRSEPDRTGPGGDEPVAGGPAEGPAQPGDIVTPSPDGRGTSSTRAMSPVGLNYEGIADETFTDDDRYDGVVRTPVRAGAAAPRTETAGRTGA